MLPIIGGWRTSHQGFFIYSRPHKSYILSEYLSFTPQPLKLFPEVNHRVPRSRECTSTFLRLVAVIWAASSCEINDRFMVGALFTFSLEKCAKNSKVAVKVNPPPITPSPSQHRYSGFAEAGYGRSIRNYPTTSSCRARVNAQ